jgi:hypothetical protein
MRLLRIDHPTVNFTYITDAHTAAHAIGKRQETYLDEILAKFDFTRGITERIHGVCLNGGDVFHHKDPATRMNPHSLTNRLIRNFAEFPFGMQFGAVGNHDLAMDRMDSLPKQPLGVLIAAEVYHDLTAESVIFENADGTVRVQVDACPYFTDDLEALQWAMNVPERVVMHGPVTYRILIMHQYGNPGNTASMHGNPAIGFNQMIGCDYDVVLWGHDHSRCERVAVGDTMHIRLGSLSRASMATDEVDRPVSIAVLSCTPERIKFQEKQIPVQPLEIAFTEAARPVERISKSADILEFFAVVDQQVSVIESSDPREVIDALCPADEPRVRPLVYDVCGI